MSQRDEPKRPTKAGDTMNKYDSLITLKREHTTWREELKKLNRQRANLDKKIDDAQREYQDIGWAIQTIQMEKKRESKSKHNRQYYSSRAVQG